MKHATRLAGRNLAVLALSLALGSTAYAQAPVTEEPSPAELAQPDASLAGSEKLLLTGGLNQLEGAAGGGLTPWAVIGGYGTQDQIGGSAFYTRVNVQDYHLDGAGALIGFLDRIELSVAQQRFDTERVGEALGLGRGFTFRQTIVGLKVKLAGDAVLEQDSWLPQLAVGLQYKKNDRGDVLSAIGAKDDQGIDFYASATKLYLSQSILANVTLRFTKANQIGILGFGGDRGNSYKPQLEGSIALLLSRKLAVGAEYRMKPDNLGFASEDDWFDVFIAWAPSKHVSLTLAYADLGSIVLKDQQRGLYASVQIGF